MNRKAFAAAASVAIALTAGAAWALWPDRESELDGRPPTASAEAVGAQANGSPGDASRPGAASAPRDTAVGTDMTAGAGGSLATTPGGANEPAPGGVSAEAARFAVGVPPETSLIRTAFRRPPAAGMLFDVDSGAVLWAHNSRRRLPIASLTKMMTALLIAERHDPDERVTIPAKAPGVEGSGIGQLRAGQRVRLQTLFDGLILVSGNDAAAALAEHDAGSIPAFVRSMNHRAAELGLSCTHFAGPAGLQDTGNYSCARDLAVLARADLANPRVAAVTRMRSAMPPFPNKRGKLELYNNHYFAQKGIPGLPDATVTGLKTGLTNGAGRCYVTTARLGNRHLGVVLLNSGSPIKQVPALLRQGFALPG